MIWRHTKISLLRVSGSFELPRVYKDYSKCLKEIQGKSTLVQVSEGSSYRKSTVISSSLPLFFFPFYSLFVEGAQSSGIRCNEKVPSSTSFDRDSSWSSNAKSCDILSWKKPNQEAAKWVLFFHETSICLPQFRYELLHWITTGHEMYWLQTFKSGSLLASTNRLKGANVLGIRLPFISRFWNPWWSTKPDWFLTFCFSSRSAIRRLTSGIIILFTLFASFHSRNRKDGKIHRERWCRKDANRVAQRRLRVCW